MIKFSVILDLAISCDNFPSRKSSNRTLISGNIHEASVIIVVYYSRTMGNKNNRLMFTARKRHFIDTVSKTGFIWAKYRR